MADPTNKRYTHAFNVQLDPTEKGMLDQLCGKLKISRGAILRALLSNSFRMHFGSEPTCATGSKCLCPQMQTTAGANPMSSEDMLRTAQQTAA